MHKKFLIILFIIGSQLGTQANSPTIPKSMGLFSGRVSRVNDQAGLVRLKVDFTNMKYLNKRDKVEFWDERGSELKCKAYIIGKSNYYILLKVPEFNFCQKFLFVAEGVNLRLFSQDLLNNLVMGGELVRILLKKRLALNSRLLGNQKELDNHIEKVNAVNMRYKVIRDKLEAEWREELGLVEEDRLSTFRSYKDLQGRILDIDNKLERYKIEDKNLKEDRWSLDPRLYYSK